MTINGDEPIRNLIRGSQVLTPQDSLQRAVGMLRASGLPALPVVHMGRAVGMISDAEALANVVPAGGCTTATVGEVMRPEPVCANFYMTRGQVAEMMAAYDTAVMPVLNEYGAYLGLVTRSDVLGAICDTLRPPSPGGMATPLGVHLTTGAVSSGAGPRGLFLTGLALFGLSYIAGTIMDRLFYFVQTLTGLPLYAMMQSPPTGNVSFYESIPVIAAVASSLLMLFLMRLSPLAGYHAAEHMVVHTIESGEPLEPDIVRQMPRVHPRCGTNLWAAAIILMMIGDVLPKEWIIPIAIVVIVLGWRTLGGYLQQYFTTKPPSDKQLANGIKVGKELIERYKAEPNRIATGRDRIISMGLVHVAMGLGLGLAIAALIQKFTGYMPMIP